MVYISPQKNTWRFDSLDTRVTGLGVLLTILGFGGSILDGNPIYALNGGIGAVLIFIGAVVMKEEDKKLPLS